jgi:hypothetical protein
LVHYPPESDTTLLVNVHASPDELGGVEAGIAFLDIQNVRNVDPLFARASFPLAKDGVAAIDPLPHAHRSEPS